MSGGAAPITWLVVILREMRRAALVLGGVLVAAGMVMAFAGDHPTSSVLIVLGFFVGVVGFGSR